MENSSSEWSSLLGTGQIFRNLRFENFRNKKALANYGKGFRQTKAYDLT